MELTSPMLTVSLPYPHFQRDLTELLTVEELSRVRLVQWSLRAGPPVGAAASDVDMVVLPFHSTAHETTEQYVSTDVLLTQLATASNARIFQAPSIGVEGLDACIPRGAVLCNAVGVMEQPTAELAVTLLLACLREIPSFLDSRSQWDNHRTVGLVGSRILVLGFGGVGMNVARMLGGFDVDVVPVASRRRSLPSGAVVHGVDELHELLPTVDGIVCTLPLSDRTAGLVDASQFSLMRDGAIFINVGRGAVVDTAALLAEASTGRLFFGLDVTHPEPLPPEHALWQLPNVVITPHVGGNTAASHRFQAQLLADQIRNLLSGETPKNLVHGEWPLHNPIR